MVWSREEVPALIQLTWCVGYCGPSKGRPAQVSGETIGSGRLLTLLLCSSTQARALELFQIPWQKLVYVSCQPKTCIRDIALLVEEYRQVYGPDTLLQIKAVQPTDQFPHTPHVEVVTLIEKVGDVGGGDTEDSIDEQ